MFTCIFVKRNIVNSSKGKKYMLKILKKKCTSETTGVIVKKKWNGDLWFLTVEYIVNGKKYRGSIVI